MHDVITSLIQKPLRQHSESDMQVVTRSVYNSIWFGLPFLPSEAVFVIAECDRQALTRLVQIFTVTVVPELPDGVYAQVQDKGGKVWIEYHAP